MKRMVLGSLDQSNEIVAKAAAKYNRSDREILSSCRDIRSLVNRPWDGQVENSVSLVSQCIQAVSCRLKLY